MCATAAQRRVSGHTGRRSHDGHTAAAQHSPGGCATIALGRTAVARRSHGGRTAGQSRGAPTTHAGTPGVLAPTGAQSRRTRAVTTSTPGLRATPPRPAPPQRPQPSPLRWLRRLRHLTAARTPKRCLHTPQHTAGQQRVGESVGGLTAGLRRSGCAQATRGREAHRVQVKERCCRRTRSNCEGGVVPPSRPGAATST
jgi:hypothetical protein